MVHESSSSSKIASRTHMAASSSRQELNVPGQGRTKVTSNVIGESQRYNNPSNYSSTERMESYRNVSSRVITSGESDLGVKYIKQENRYESNVEHPPKYHRNLKRQNDD